jgi:hypothetical protein
MAAESLMLDTFTAYAPTGKTKNADGMEVAGYAVRGTTPGKVQSRSREGDTSARRVSVGGADRPVVEGGIHVPVDGLAPVGGNLGVGWELVLTTPGPMTPAELTDSRWLVIDSPAKSYMTARRLDVVRLS